MTILFAHPDNLSQAARLAKAVEIELGALSLHQFPDGETLLQIESDVRGQDVVLYCSLNEPDGKAMALLFFAETARALGAVSVSLTAPYLGYMRQDKRFHEGEAITSDIFGGFLSKVFDHLVTVDPHLHRHKSMDEVYSIPTTVLHAAGAIGGWINRNVDCPLLIGPDEESEQWVSEVAALADAPFTVLTKVRRGDRDVEVSVPDIAKYQDHNPVLVDDIISTAGTMADGVKKLLDLGMPAPICVGIHGVFADDAFDLLSRAGAGRIVTCNTIPHETNQIDLTDTLARAPILRP